MILFSSSKLTKLIFLNISIFNSFSSKLVSISKNGVKVIKVSLSYERFLLLKKELKIFNLSLSYSKSNLRLLLRILDLKVPAFVFLFNSRLVIMPEFSNLIRAKIDRKILENFGNLHCFLVNICN